MASSGALRAPDAPQSPPLGALPFVLAGLSFLPLLGVPFGLVAIILGLLKIQQGGWKVVIIGCSGIAFTVVLYGALFYFGFVQRGGIYDDLRTQMARGNLDNVVQAVEVYKLQHGSYPDSLKTLHESLPENSMVFVFDPTDIKFTAAGSPKYFYYERVGDDHYYLRGVGPDGVPFTSDDILPQLKVISGSKLGLLTQHRQPD